MALRGMTRVRRAAPPARGVEGQHGHSMDLIPQAEGLAALTTNHAHPSQAKRKVGREVHPRHPAHAIRIAIWQSFPNKLRWSRP